MARTNRDISSKLRHSGPVGKFLQKMWDYLSNHVKEGLIISAPSTGSTHADAGAYDFNVNISAGWCIVNGVQKYFAAQADFDVDADDPSPIDDTDVDITYTIVAKNVAGTITCVAVAGAAATTGASVEPTDAVILAAAGPNYIKLGTTVLTRSAADACTQVYTNAERPYINEA